MVPEGRISPKDSGLWVKFFPGPPADMDILLGLLVGTPFSQFRRCPWLSVGVEKQNFAGFLAVGGSVGTSP